MLERDIVAAIKKYLTSLGEDVFFWKEHGGPYGTSGIPDIIVCYKGRFIGMECKLPGGRLTELQKTGDCQDQPRRRHCPPRGKRRGRPGNHPARG